jgi:hypothetical protein
MSEMNVVTKEIANDFNQFKFKICNITKILHQNFNKEFMNDNFDDQELIEEQIDILLFGYESIKQKLRKARIMKINAENGENMKKQ